MKHTVKKCSMPIVVLFSIFGVCFGHIFMGNRLLSRNEAEQACGTDTTSGHLTPEEILSEEELDHIGKELSDGDSAWVGNIADFSSFVFYYGCYPGILLGEEDSVIDKNSIYKCSNACSSKYIGLLLNKCFCIDRIPQYKLFPGQSPPKCARKCNSLFGESCGDSVGASIYQIVQEDTIGFGQVGSGFDQCTMLRNEGSTFARTEPCDSPCDKCAYICKVNDSSVMSSPCQFVGVCILFGDREYNWRQAAGRCSQHDGGYLFNASVRTHDQLGVHLINTFGFWTGFFRTFEINRDKTVPSSTDACVAVRKSGNVMRFEATDCSNKKYYICSASTTSFVPVTKATTALETRSSTGSTTSTDNTVNLGQTGSSDSDGFPVWVIIVIVIGIIALFFIILLVCVLVLRRKRRLEILDHRDTRSTASTEYSMKHRYGLDGTDLYRIPADESYVRASTPTLDLGLEYNAEWNGGPESSTNYRSDRTGTNSRPKNTINGDMDPVYNTIGKMNTGARNKGRNEKNGHGSHADDDNSYRSSPRSVKSNDDGPTEHNKTGMNIERPIKTYLDYMYAHLKSNINKKA